MFSAIKCPGLCCATALLGDFYPHETWIIIQLIQINSVSGITTTGVKYLTDIRIYMLSGLSHVSPIIFLRTRLWLGFENYNL